MTGCRRLAAAVCLAGGLLTPPAPAAQPHESGRRASVSPNLAAPTPPATAAQPHRGLTAVDGIEVGHHTLSARPTGCTVVLAAAGAVAGVDVRGGAPGTRETDLLDPARTVQQVHAVVLAGGSAFGLDAAGGVVRYLSERGVGYETRAARVPIVPAAILFDLGVGGDPAIRPTADCGYRAAAAAGPGPVAEGNVGAGAGATVGKLGGAGRAMKGGVGSAAITVPGGLVVAALAAVNAVGDVIDPATGRVVAGVRTPDGRGLADARTLLRAGTAGGGRPRENTTLGVVATNAALTQAEATAVARMAHDGLARAVVPAHTPSDGDAIFALATGRRGEPASAGTVGALAAEAMAEAVVRAVRAARGIPGYPAARDLARRAPPAPFRTQPNAHGRAPRSLPDRTTVRQPARAHGTRRRRGRMGRLKSERRRAAHESPPVLRASRRGGGCASSRPCTSRQSCRSPRRSAAQTPGPESVA